MELGPGALSGEEGREEVTAGTGVPETQGSPAHQHQEDRKMDVMGQLEQAGLEAREEAREATGLCAEGAEGPEDQDPKRVDAPPRCSCGRDPSLWCPPAGDAGCSPVWGF